MVTQSRESIVEELRALKAGVEKNLTGEAMTYAGRVYSGADVVARIDEMLDAARDVRLAKGALIGALAKEKELLAEGAGFVQALRTNVKIRYRNAPPTLAEFALEPKKPRTSPTAEERLVMSAKNRATRKERGTLGKRQKKAVRGGVTGVLITPIVKKKDPKGE